ncbi:hypothetical protein WN55_11503 [Dufourea novaeangliae]|uniref:Uncharacterized protein n=1 Tax=Dufourea novaeangliae TaxID=178035 RepID=A0A154PCW2_DUFNO|nr:hypothetical protein WN55_11503 [Dufourea novaeangliae]
MLPCRKLPTFFCIECPVFPCRSQTETGFNSGVGLFGRIEIPFGWLPISLTFLLPSFARLFLTAEIGELSE